jgi:hypothetical protein
VGYRSVQRPQVKQKTQQKLHDEARFIPLLELAFLCASGPWAAVPGLGLITSFAHSGPSEDVQLKA